MTCSSVCVSIGCWCLSESWANKGIQSPFWCFDIPASSSTILILMHESPEMYTTSSFLSPSYQYMHEILYKELDAPGEGGGVTDGACVSHNSLLRSLLDLAR